MIQNERDKGERKRERWIEREREKQRKRDEKRRRKGFLQGLKLYDRSHLRYFMRLWWIYIYIYLSRDFPFDLMIAHDSDVGRREICMCEQVSLFFFFYFAPCDADASVTSLWFVDAECQLSGEFRVTAGEIGKLMIELRFFEKNSTECRRPWRAVPPETTPDRYQSSVKLTETRGSACRALTAINRATGKSRGTHRFIFHSSEIAR